jgi:glycosyltransferase involved in cell wall biosynthesis
MMPDPSLTICIASLFERSSSLAALLASLAHQVATAPVEVLVAVDARTLPVGTKRNQLVAASRGRYVAHVDDDDQVAPSYVAEVLAAIGRRPGVDVVTIRGERIDDGRKRWEFDYRLSGGFEAREEGGMLWKSPDHLCAVRADLAKAQPFLPVLNEDVEWAQVVAPRIRTIERAGDEVLYRYLTSTNRAEERARERR